MLTDELRARLGPEDDEDDAWVDDEDIDDDEDEVDFSGDDDGDA